MSNGIPPPPPPNLRPPPEVVVKKRKNLTIKHDEFEAWSELKGDMSWTAVMAFVRSEYLRLRDLKPIVMRGGGNGGIERIKRDDEAKVQRRDPNRTELMREMNKLFSDVDNIKSLLTKVPEEELEAIKLARTERVKNRAMM